jgi:hypothetical protein
MGNELLLGESDPESFLECHDHLDDVEPHPHLEGRGHLTPILRQDARVMLRKSV